MAILSARDEKEYTLQKYEELVQFSVRLKREHHCLLLKHREGQRWLAELTQLETLQEEPEDLQAGGILKPPTKDQISPEAGGQQDQSNEKASRVAESGSKENKQDIVPTQASASSSPPVPTHPQMPKPGRLEGTPTLTWLGFNC